MRIDARQGGESFDSAQDREPVERLVEPFEFWFLVLGILMLFVKQVYFEISVNYLLLNRLGKGISH